MTTAIKAIFFDFDGVLTTDKSGSLTTLRSLSRQTDIAEEDLWQAFAPFNDDLLHGRTTHTRIWAQICESLERQLPSDMLDIAFRDTPMNPPMLMLAGELAKYYRVGIITDNKADRMESLTRLHDLARVFDPIVVSSTIGSGKDAPRIFEHAMQRLSARPDECIFIDNTPRNLCVPKALGMATIHFDDERNDVEGLRRAISRICRPRPH